MNTKIRLLQLFNHIPALYGIYFLATTQDFFWLGVTAISFLIIGPISTVITLHRLLTHRSFKTHQWLENVLSFISVYSTLGPTVAWVALHRYHHATADTEKDPHSPYNGVFRAWTGYGWKVENIPMKYVKDLMRNKLHRWIFKHYFKIIISSVIVLILIDPLLAVFLYALPSVLTLHGTSAVNFLGHWHGYRTYDTPDKSTNSWLANIISLGDGWHNNHHRYPSQYTNSKYWWEWDLMAMFIRLIRTN